MNDPGYKWPSAQINLVLITACVLLASGCNNAAVKQQSLSKNKNELIVDSILQHSATDFRSIEKDGITFYFEADQFFNHNIDRLIDEALKSKEHCFRILNRKEMSDGLRIIYFNDRERFRPYFNMAPKGLALPDANTLIIATNDTLRAYHTHELMHIISISTFGGYPKEPSAWMHEGISVFADNPCLGYSVDEIAAYLLHNHQLPSLDSLFNHFRQLPDMKAYLYAGSLTGYIINQYGLHKWEALWQQGVAELPAVLGISYETLEKTHHRFLRQQYPLQPIVNWEVLQHKGCG